MRAIDQDTAGMDTSVLHTASLGGFALAALAVWRVTHLLAAEDGPGDVFARWRGAVHGRFWGGLFGCFYCLSLWVAVPASFAVAADGWVGRVVVWLALSGAACLLERIGQPAAAPALFYEGDEETSHELLRRSAPGHEPPGAA